MAYKTRKTPDVMVNALVAAHNFRQEESVASFFHADTTQKTSGHYQNMTVADDLVTAADGSGDATNSTLANEIKAVLNRHFADTLAHDTAVSAQVSTADGTDEASNVTLANALKSAYNTHLSASNVHFNNDGTNDVTSSNATDTASTSTLLNEMKDDLNAHIVSAPAGAMIELIPA